MKKLQFFLALTWLTLLGLHAQSPESFNYQAVVRDAGGNVLPNQAVSFRMNIRQGSATGTTVYSETHSATTNGFGLVNLQIGTGTVVSGTFANIGWGSNSHFLEIELDETGGSNYTVMGTQQLISVPYALHATTVELDAVDDADADPGNELQTLSLSGDTLNISSGNNIVLPPGTVDTDDQTLSISNDSLSIADGNAVDLSPYLDNTDTDDQTLSINNDSLAIADGNAVDLSPYLDDTDTDDQTISISNDTLYIQDGNSVDLSAYAVDNVNDADADPNNELQTLSVNNDSLFLSNGGFVVLDDGNWNINGNDLYAAVSGNVGIGQSTPLELLHMTEGNLLVAGFNGSNSGIEIEPLNSANNGGGRIFFRETPTDNFGISMGFNGGNSGSEILNWPTNSFNISTHNNNATGIVRLTLIRNSGYLGIGTSGPSTKLHVQDSLSGSGTFVATIENKANTSNSGGLLIQAGENTQTVTNRFISFARPNGTEIGSCRQIGTATIQYSTTSDFRLKTNLQPTRFGLADLMKIEVKDYSYKDELNKTHTGFIAQQLAAHYPEAVSVGGEDAKTNPWMVDYGQVTPLLVKSVQEQQETIASLIKMVEELKAQVKSLKEK